MKSQSERVLANCEVPCGSGGSAKPGSGKGVSLVATRWAPAHTSRAAIQYLQGQFPGKVISKRGDVPWPPRSPDLAILDFFAWGYLKQMILGTSRDRHPRNIEQLKAAIVRECAALPREMVSNAFHSLVDRARRCIAANGRHFEN